MRRDPKTYLHDVAVAAERILQFTAGRTFEDYERDIMLRSAVERQFEIVGEALTQLHQVDRALAARVPDQRRIVAFRNVLVHGYAKIDDRRVWDAIDADLPALRAAVDALLRE